MSKCTALLLINSSDKQSKIIYWPEKPIGGGCLIDIEKAKNKKEFRSLYARNSFLVIRERKL